MIEMDHGKRTRLDAPGSLHHVIVRGIERRRIFETEKDREDFLDRLETVVINMRIKKWKKG